MHSKQEQIERSRRKACGSVRAVSHLVNCAKRGIARGGSTGWDRYDHEQLVSAWQGGLDWFKSLEGGRALYEDWLDYLRALKAAGCDGGSFAEAFEDLDGI